MRGLDNIWRWTRRLWRAGLNTAAAFQRDTKFHELSTWSECQVLYVEQLRSREPFPIPFPYCIYGIIDWGKGLCWIVCGLGESVGWSAFSTRGEISVGWSALSTGGGVPLKADSCCKRYIILTSVLTRWKLLLVHTLVARDRCRDRQIMFGAPAISPYTGHSLLVGMAMDNFCINILLSSEFQNTTGKEHMIFCVVKYFRKSYTVCFVFRKLSDCTRKPQDITA